MKNLATYLDIMNKISVIINLGVVNKCRHVTKALGMPFQRSWPPQPFMGVLDPYGRDIIKRRSKTFGTISVLIPILLHFDVLIDNFSILQYYTSKYYFSPDKTVCLTKDWTTFVRKICTYNLDEIDT